MAPKGETAALLCATALIAGCGALIGIQDPIVVDDDAGSHDEASCSACVGSDASSGSDDASQDATDVAADAGQGGEGGAGADGADRCANLSGPSMVHAGTFCVDSTEVTQRQYALFLAAKGSDTSGQPAACSGNSTFSPSSCAVPFNASSDTPVVCIDWCDAVMYCQWAGKRLCGKIGGGTNAFADFTDATKSQWYAACSKFADGNHAYPYGNTFSATQCNGAGYDAGHALPVGSVASCQGGVSGVFDMSGNIFELEDSCETVSGPAVHCRVRGGSYTTTDPTTLSCADDDWLGLPGSNDFTGFRCCKD